MTNGIKRMDVAQFMREYQEKKENRKKQEHTDSSFPQILEQEMKRNHPHRPKLNDSKK